MNKIEVTHKEFQSFENSFELLTRVLSVEISNISKSEVKKLIIANAITINKVKLNIDIAMQKPSYKLLKNKFLFVQKGKHYHAIVVN